MAPRFLLKTDFEDCYDIYFERHHPQKDCDGAITFRRMMNQGRFLQIGDQHFWLRYESDDDWRSNCGDCEIALVAGPKKGYHKSIHEPLFAIDFVICGKQYAIDFNVCPGVSGTGVEREIGPRGCAEAIQKAIVDLKDE